MYEQKGWLAPKLLILRLQSYEEEREQQKKVEDFFAFSLIVSNFAVCNSEVTPLLCNSYFAKEAENDEKILLVNLVPHSPHDDLGTPRDERAG